ncbi:MAG: DUF1361 domain-containing protein [Bacteroidetes bacterium]|nr:DUF1361 domain-containing protein [Bacteroidota bacterium]
MNNQNKMTLALAFFSVFCIALEVVRIHLSDTASFCFLIWNLLLAWVPYILAQAFTTQDLRRQPLIALGILAIWVLFLPNGPYIITDLLHLRQRIEIPLWYDVILVSSYAWLGLLLTLLSVRQIHHKLKDHFAPGKLWIALPVLFLSSGYGIYLGRFLRWNSWDVFFRPIYLLRRSLVELIHPFSHPQPLQVTVVIGLLLTLSYAVFYLSHHQNLRHESE